jgi:hypothetical protein
MITAITGILAALTGMVPGILQFFTLKATNAQQLAIEQLRMQAAKDGIALQIDLANSQSDIQQQQHLYDFAAGASGIKWIDALAILVRPFITIIVFAMWVAVEIALLYSAMHNEFGIAAVADAVWDENTQQIFMAIVGFWFGNRMLARGQQQMAATLAVTPGAPATGNAPAKPVARPVADPSSFVPAPAGSRD